MKREHLVTFSDLVTEDRGQRRREVSLTCPAVMGSHSAYTAYMTRPSHPTISHRIEASRKFHLTAL